MRIKVRRVLEPLFTGREVSSLTLAPKHGLPGRNIKRWSSHSADANGTSLPLPPLLDPKKIAARERHRKPKARPGPRQALTPLQEKLRKSPYAKALATPLRTCAMTSNRLPSFFLQEFDAYAHPETGKPWLLPQEIQSTGLISSDGQISPDPGEENESASTGHKAQVSSTAQAHPSSISRSLAQQPLMLRAKSSKLWRRLYNPNVTHKTEIHEHDLVWREDMDEFILDQLRRKVVSEVAYCVRKGNYVWDWPLTDSKPPPQPGCVLWLQTPVAQQQQATSTGEQAAEEESDASETNEKVSRSAADTSALPSPHLPPRFVSIVTTGEGPTRNRFPAYNMSELLGEEQLTALKAAMGPLVDSVRVVLRGKMGTLEPRLALWKLKGYMEGTAGYWEAERIERATKLANRRIARELARAKTDAEGQAGSG